MSRVKTLICCTIVILTIVASLGSLLTSGISDRREAPPSRRLDAAGPFGNGAEAGDVRGDGLLPLGGSRPYRPPTRAARGHCGSCVRRRRRTALNPSSNERPLTRLLAGVFVARGEERAEKTRPSESDARARAVEERGARPPGPPLLLAHRATDNSNKSVCHRRVCQRSRRTRNGGRRGHARRRTTCARRRLPKKHGWTTSPKHERSISTNPAAAADRPLEPVYRRTSGRHGSCSRASSRALGFGTV